ncbi:MAG: large conductance mechanosensitive channel protein MscL [Clostridia bacterium]|nr:large conductance mechanosensitive channel protein MscL [Clostridia bacterium]
MAKEKKKSTFWADFKAFITRGNVIDMAVGVVVGGAFGKITSGLVSYIISPVIGLITGGVDLASVKTVLVEEIKDAAGEITQAEVAIQWGMWIQTIIDFIIVAFCIFCVVRLIAKMNKKLNEKKEAEKAAADAAAAEKAAADKAAADAAAAEKEAENKALRQAIFDIRDSLKKN